MNPSHNDIAKQTLEDLLYRGLIQPSDSPYGSPILLARKKDGSMRLCVDYRALNDITEKDRYPLPRINELLDRIKGAAYFSTIDLASGYWQVRVAPEDVPKTSFQTRYGAYEFLVMPFGLTNAPASFQRLMNNVFAGELDDSVVAYVDDVLVFSKTLEEHKAHLEAVMNRLHAHHLFAKRKKCQFLKCSIEFLGHIVSAEGLRPDPKKVQAITSLQAPANIHELRSFLGCANFYRRFIERFAHRAAPLTDLLRQNVSYHWVEDHQHAFEDLKGALTSAPVLRPPDMDRPFFLHTDASKVALGAALMQSTSEDPQSKSSLAPIAFASRVLTETERRWTTHERELFGIIYGLKQFRHYLLGTSHPTHVRTDHDSLKYFQRQKHLTDKQARWLDFLQEYDIHIQHIDGKANVVADALSRLRTQPLLLSNAVTLNVFSTVTSDLISDDMHTLMEAYQEDKTALEAWEDIDQNRPTPFTSVDGLLYRHTQLYVPVPDMQRQLLEEYHDRPTAGHLGRDKTFKALRERFWWPKMYADVPEYVGSCPTCQASKPRTSLPAGKLSPLPIPNQPWESLSMDIMGPIQKTSNGFDGLVVFVDRLTKMVHIAPCTMEHTAADFARLFYRHVFRLHGLPRSIVSDRDPRWTSRFWETVFSKLGTRLNMSTAFHPQTDGQSENAIKTVQQILRSLMEKGEREWDECLPAVEFAMNNSVHASTGTSPFEASYGYKPLLPIDLTQLHKHPATVPAAQDWLVRQAELLEFVKAQLAEAQLRQKQYADTKRSDHTFQAGDLVKLVSSALDRNEHTKALGKKLGPKYCGPFRIEAMVGTNAATLELPGTVSKRKHRTFNVDKLMPWRESDKFPRDDTTLPNTELPTSATVQGEPGYFPDSFLERRYAKGPSGRKRWEILVSWRGYQPEDNSWEPEWRLRQDLGKDFDLLYSRLGQPAEDSDSESDLSG